MQNIKQLAPDEDLPFRLYSIKQVAEMLNCSIPTIYRRLEDDPDFPDKIKITPGSGKVGFRSDELLEYIEKKRE